MEIKLKQFPTHIEKTNNKIAPNKFWKVNNQSIYNGSVNTFARAIVVKNLHNYIMSHLTNLPKFKDRVEVDIIIKTVINHGSIQRRKGKITWKKPKNDYEPTWDEDNLTAIWTKTIRDSLSKAGIIKDDNVAFVKGGYRGIEFVEDIDDREIIIKIKKV